MALCFLDANAGAPCSAEVIAAMCAWMNRGSTASEHASALEARALADSFRREIAVECSITLEEYNVIFTSGGAESNALVLTGAARSFAAKTGRLPHIITSAADHRSALDCCAQLEKERLCQVTVLPAGASAAELKRALRPNTCLVSIIAASGETGAVADLRPLVQVARAAQVPFHADAAQLFGRARMTARGLDAFSISMHKFGGPPGVGALVVRRSFAEGYGLQPLVFRGGAENTPGLAASLTALRAAVEARAPTTERWLRLRAAIRAALAMRLRCFELAEHPDDPRPSIDGGITPPPAPRAGSAAAHSAIEESDAPLIFWITEKDATLPNTLALAVRQTGFSASAARAALECRGVIVGVCSFEGPAALRSAALRVSMSDATTGADVRRFITEFLAIVADGSALRAARPAPPPTSRPRRGARPGSRPKSPPSRSRRA